MGTKARVTSVSMALLTVLATGCGSSSPGSGTNNEAGNSASGATTINLYTSESEDLVSGMMKDFESKNPGIKVNIFRSGTGPVEAKLDAERSTGNAIADVIWFADIGYFHKLAGTGELFAYQSPQAKNIDQHFVYEGGKYTEVRQIFNVIGYNTKLVTTPPKSWSDLTNPSLKGKVALANPSYSGAAFQTLATLVEDNHLGWNYFSGLKSNGVKFEQSNGALTNKLASGEYGAVSIVDFMVRNAKAKGSPVDTVWPSEGAVLIPTPVGILSSSKHQGADEKLIDYLLSTDGQKLFVQQGYIPVRSDVGVPKGTPSVSSIKVYPLDLNYIDQNRKTLKSKFESMFVGG